MSLRIGLDDTDPPLSGCTTSTFDELLSLLVARISGIHIIERGLVRLWPFAARRTRGNGALRAEISILQSSKEEFRNLCCEWFEGVLEEVGNQPNSPIPAATVLLV